MGIRGQVAISYISDFTLTTEFAIMLAVCDDRSGSDIGWSTVGDPVRLIMRPHSYTAGDHLLRTRIV